MHPSTTPVANVSILDVIVEFLFVVFRVSAYRRSATMECWVRFTEFAHSVFHCLIFDEIFLNCRNFWLEFSSLFLFFLEDVKNAVDRVSSFSSFQSQQHDMSV